jgi:ribosomal-protein-alanine N-acetyltransferase
MKFQGECAHLLLLVVQPKSRNCGIGKALLRRLEKSCQRAGIRNVRLELRASNATARHFYEALGYHAAGGVPGYYDRRESAIIMARVLD